MHHSSQPTLICVKPLNGIRALIQGHDRGEASRRYAQLKHVFSQSLDYLLFAEPVFDSSGNRITWFTELEGPAVRFIDLDEDQREDYTWRLKEKVNAMMQHASAMKAKGEVDFGEILEQSLEIPSLEDIYIFEGRLVLIEWGFVGDRYNAPRGLIKKLIGEARPRVTPLQVIVETEDGRPIPGASLAMRHGSQIMSGTSDQAGRVVFETAPAGVSVSLLTQAVGYQDHTSTIETTVSEHHVRPEAIPALPPVATAAVTPPDKKKKPWGCWLGLLLLLLLLPLLFGLIFPGWWQLIPLVGGLPGPPSPAVANPSMETLELTVLDKNTQQPITDAMVILNAQEGSQLRTDHKGRVMLSTSRDGENLIATIRAEGYGEARRTLACCAPITMELEALEEGGLVGHTGAVRINLKWNSCADLDLHVIDPCGNAINHTNRQAQCSDLMGRLDHDSNAGDSLDCQNPQENIYWANHLPGDYQVEVRYYAPKRNSGATDYLLTIQIGDQTQTQSGTLTHNQRSEPFVLTVPE